MNNKKETSITTFFSAKKIILPIFFAIIMTFFVSKNYKSLNTKVFSFEDLNFKYLFISIFFIFLRDFFFALRLNKLTENKITIKKSLMLIGIWDFSSALTPSVAGGGIVIIFLLTKEGLKFSKSLTTIILAALLDNLVFFFFSILGFFSIQRISETELLLNLSSKKGIFTIFIIGMLILILYTFFIIFSLWVNPRLMKWYVIKITKIKFLRRFKNFAISQGDNLLIASNEIKSKNKNFWIKVFGYTFLAIFSKYAILNSILYSKLNINLIENITSFGNQAILWIIMLLSPTPGSSGSSEFFFNVLYNDLLGSDTTKVQIIWRIFTYYIHILIGIIILFFYMKKNKKK